MTKKRKKEGGGAAPDGGYRPSTTPRRYVSPPLRLGVDADTARADIEVHGLDHAGASFEGRVFLNNVDADETTPRTPAAGYAGTFHVFGHGGCVGDDESHCCVRVRRPYDPRPEHPLTPMRKVVMATEALRRAAAKGKTARITIVPVISSATQRCEIEHVLRFETLHVVTYG